ALLIRSPAVKLKQVPVRERKTDLAGHDSLREHLRLPGYTADCLYALAFNSLTVGEVRRAEKFFAALCLLEAGAAHAFLGYGLCKAHRGELHQAGHLFRLAARIAPDWAVPHYHLAAICIEQGRTFEAKSAIDRFF